MKLQVAVDSGGRDSLLRMAERVYDLVDIIEVGTPMIILDGQNPVRALRNKYPAACIVSDTKIMDGGSTEAQYACEAGADIVTVLAVSSLKTISAVVSEVHRYSKQVLADLIDVQDVVRRTKQLDAMGVDYICVHTAYDVQPTGVTPLADLEKVMATVKNSKVAVAGGISKKTIREVAKMGPDLVIIGGAITNAVDPRTEVEKYRKIIKRTL